MTGKDASKCVTFPAMPAVLSPYHRILLMYAMPHAPATPPLAPALALVLDEASLQRLHELDPQGENHVVERVLRAFATSLVRLLPKAQQALAQSDTQALRHVVHTLKSSSASVGALQLSRCCTEIDNCLRLQQVQGLADRLAVLDAECTRALAAVRRLLPE